MVDAIAQKIEAIAEQLKILAKELEAVGVSKSEKSPVPVSQPETTVLKAIQGIIKEGVTFISIKNNVQVKASGRLVYGQDGKPVFRVLEGAKVCPHVGKSLRAVYVRMRKDLEENGTWVNWVQKKEVDFPSPSAAASVLFGTPRDGLRMWSFEQRTLGEYLKMRHVTLQQLFPFVKE